VSRLEERHSGKAYVANYERIPSPEGQRLQ